jgi:non-ribosomal peptide synthetase component F
VVFRPDGADTAASARQAGGARSLRPSLGSLCGRGFSDEASADSDGKTGDPRYANLYGPTETNVCAYYEVEPLSPEETAPIPIGKACANTDLIPINAEGKRVVTTNEEGLLYARGSTVMQGYYGRPEASAACFIPNPFAAGRDEKLYCTGDWVTLDEKGNYLFVGRKDHMIKTRGYRV